MTDRPDDRPPITPGQFVTAWQASSTLPEVAARTGLTPAVCSARASFYRKSGIRLKYLETERRGAAIDIDEMNRLVERLGGPPADAPDTPAPPPEELLERAEERRRRNAELIRTILGRK